MKSVMECQQTVVNTAIDNWIRNLHACSMGINRSLYITPHARLCVGNMKIRISFKFAHHSLQVLAVQLVSLLTRKCIAVQNVIS